MPLRADIRRAASFPDLIAWLEATERDGTEADAARSFVDWLVLERKGDVKAAREAGVPRREMSGVAMQLFRAEAITAMASAVIEDFVGHHGTLMGGGLDGSLLAMGVAGKPAERPRALDKAHAYRDRAVMRLDVAHLKRVCLVPLVPQGCFSSGSNT